MQIDILSIATGAMFFWEYQLKWYELSNCSSWLQRLWLSIYKYSIATYIWDSALQKQLPNENFFNAFWITIVNILYIHHRDYVSKETQWN